MDEYLSKEVKVTINKEGFGRPITKGSVVRLDYTGKFLDGRVFDSTYVKGKPIEIPVGIGAAIKAWDVAICGLQKGSNVTI
jgi:FKBP-type peptidyl-prolyl cis-trans isomerase